jgi:hypothetical protein
MKKQRVGDERHLPGTDAVGCARETRVGDGGQVFRSQTAQAGPSRRAEMRGAAMWWRGEAQREGVDVACWREANGLWRRRGREVKQLQVCRSVCSSSAPIQRPTACRGPVRLQSAGVRLCLYYALPRAGKSLALVPLLRRVAEHTRMIADDCTTAANRNGKQVQPGN